MRPSGPRTPPKYLEFEEMEEEMSKVEKVEDEGFRIQDADVVEWHKVDETVRP